MTPKGVATAYVEKATRALAAARLLLGERDSEGTCNRAYYAMFYAAQAMLLAADPPIAPPKTHRGLIAAFGRHIVLDGRMDAEFGRSLNEVQHLRELADYLGDAPALAEAESALAAAETFLQAVQMSAEL